MNFIYKRFLVLDGINYDSMKATLLKATNLFDRTLPSDIQATQIPLSEASITTSTNIVEFTNTYFLKTKGVITSYITQKSVVYDISISEKEKNLRQQIFAKENKPEKVGLIEEAVLFSKSILHETKSKVTDFVDYINNYEKIRLNLCVSNPCVKALVPKSVMNPLTVETAIGFDNRRKEHLDEEERNDSALCTEEEADFENLLFNKQCEFLGGF
ncbi:hypothetical protein HDU92_008147 [Lobulomyces angularis]|nr:hypothetical protein HDU92_008147 [Lobulomyces angularis]